ncbi:MAG: non-ribosomal peptide synthetase, partial [Cytophagales bacterium]|nr:non-ribosomal peptide synthetase [Cytophagales bacterium]
MLSAKNIKDIYGLSPLQEGLLFHALTNPGSTAYVGQVSYRLEGNLRVPLLEQSFNVLFSRHDMLRTVFSHNKAERPLQVVLRERKVDFTFRDLQTAGDPRARLERVEQYKAEDKRRGFDVTRDTLMRLAVFQLEAQVFEVVWSWHHIIMDGWCLGILQAEFVHVYDCLLQGRSPDLPPAPPYRSYIDWLGRQHAGEAQEFWARYLRGYEGVASLPLTYSALHADGYQLGEYALRLDKHRTAGLNALAARRKVTLNTVLQVLWGLALGRYSGRQDVVFGTVVSGRPAELEGVESTVGLFINTIPVRIVSGPGKRFSELLGEVKQDLAGSEPYHHVQLADLQRTARGREPLFNHVLVFENYPLPGQEPAGARPDEPAAESFNQLTISNLEVFDHNHYPLNVVVVPGGELEVRFSFNELAYHPGFIAQLAEGFAHLADQVLHDEETPVEALELLPAAARDQLLARAGGPPVYQPGSTLVERFEQCVA